ncbi:MAG TPA: BTAD domain-containing putative transcriptional regulator [Blastococcus sp.]|nr:BTAD domain-containing putative transcriptional regulator [Blastococcus sp.]
MRIAVLGPLEVLTDELAPVAVPGAKERLLLAVLVAGAPGVVSTDRLAEALWNGEPPVSARKSLQAHLVRLRSSLEPDRPHGSTGRYVVRRGQGYALTVGRGDIDALRIGDLAARGRAQLAGGDPAEAARLLASACELWRGEPYADWPDAAFAEPERRRLAELRSGALAGLLEARLNLGLHAEVLPELEALVAQDPLREDWWRLLMLALYRAGRQADALATGWRVRALLADELGTEPGPGLRQAEAAILAQDPALEPQRGPAAAPPGPALAGACPYKGLAAYQVEDAPLFHGRRRLVAALVARLVDAGVVVVSGPSGAGKSSVVRAGLVPELARGSLPGSESWRPVIVTPGRNPVDVLAPLTGESPPTAPVLLVCDQLEELWAPGVDPAERAAFLDAVLGLLDDGIVVRCVAVLRGDHVGRLAEHAAFTEALAGALVLVSALTEDELREIVVEPARAVGLTVEPALLDAVVADVLGRTGALPLLSTALVGTWERRRGDVLALAGYLEAGGVAGALARSAESTYARLGPLAQEQARRVFVRLADVDEGGALVRRRVPLAELDLDDDRRAGTRAVVEAFVSRRLLAVDADRLEVTHEALLTGWPRLARWLEDDAAGRAVRRTLAPAARDWAEGGRPADELYRGARLAGALDWASGEDADLTPLEGEFLDASRARGEAELTEARDRARREATGRRRTRRLAMGLGAVLVVALVATFLAVRAQRDAQRASLIADANRLAALSTTAGRLDLSLLLAAQAVRLADTPETQDGLLAALAENQRLERVVSFDGFPYQMNLAGDGRVLFLDAGSLMAWQVGVETPPPTVVDVAADMDGWRVVAPSPTDDVLLAAGQGAGDPWVRTVAPDGSTRLVVEGAGIGGTPVNGGFSSDGRRIHLLVRPPVVEDDDAATRWSLVEIDAGDGAVRDSGIGGAFPGSVDRMAVDFADVGGTAVLWDNTGAAAPTIIVPAEGRTSLLEVQSRSVESLGFTALTSGAAQLWEDGAVTLFDSSGTPVQQLGVHQEQVRDIAVAPDGTWAVTVGDGPLVVVWDVDPQSDQWSQREVLTGHRGDVVDVALDADRGRLITMSLDNTIITWDMGADGGFGRSYPRLEDGRWISNRPEIVEPGRLLVAPTRTGAAVTEDLYAGPGPGSASVAATFLDPETGEVVDQVVVGDTDEQAQMGSSVAVSPDRSMVAVTWAFGTTVLDARTRDVIAKIVLPSEGDVATEQPAPTVVWCAGWTPDGSTLLLGADTGVPVDAQGNPVGPPDGYIATVDTRTWEVDGRIDIDAAVQSIDVSPDRRQLAVASLSHPEIVLLDAATLELQRRVPLLVDDITANLAYSPDGRMLAGGGQTGLLQVFDTATWEPAWEPATVHDQWLLQTEWLADGRTVVTSGRDGTVSLFDTERGLMRGRPLRASGQPGEGYAHLIPGAIDELVVLAGNRTGRRYPMEPSVWLDEACSIVARDLTPAEWNRYLPDQEYAPTCSDLP